MIKIKKKFYLTLTAFALFLGTGCAAFAQTAPLRGKVELKKADGTVSPVQGAVVDVFRTDAKGNPGSAKTDKKGVFSFAGLPLGQVFALSVSAPGVRADIFPNVKAGMEGITITVYEGDGKALTEDEVRTALTPSAATGNQPSAKEVEDAKKAQAEYDKKVAEVNTKNAKIQKTNDIVNAALKEGSSAFDAKNYDLAITKFDEGVNADPDFVGTAPVLLNNKALALRMRGFDNYKKSATDTANKAALMEKAKSDWTTSVASSNRALELLKSATGVDAALQKNYDTYKYNALSSLIETYRLLILTKADQSKTKEANAAYTEYLATETDPAKKLKAQMQLGDIMREAGDSENAIAAYRLVLASDPNNADAMAGLGLSLFNVGVTGNDKAQMQEGLNYMQKFADTAPATHPLKASVKAAVDYLKTQEKLAPQKVTSKGGKKTN